MELLGLFGQSIYPHWWGDGASTAEDASVHKSLCCRSCDEEISEDDLLAANKQEASKGTTIMYPFIPIICPTSISREALLKLAEMESSACAHLLCTL